MKTGGENTVKITDILISHFQCDIRHLFCGVAQHPRRLRKSLFLQKLRIGLAGNPLDLSGEPSGIIMQDLCDFGQTSVSVMLFNITQNLHHRILLFGTHRQFVGMI